MQNFNTNQTRHFYSAKTLGTASDYNEFAPGAIAFKKTGDDKAFYFVFKNHDDLLTRTDLVNPKNVVSVKLATTKLSATAPFKSIARPLLMQEIEVDTSKITFGATPVFAGTDETLIGKSFDLAVTIHGWFDYDMANSLPILASVTGTATNLASAAAFVKAVADALVLARPKSDPKYPLVDVYYNDTKLSDTVKAEGMTSATATKFYIVQGPQKFVLGKLSGEPCPFSVAAHLAYKNLDDINWIKETAQVPAEIDGSALYIPGARQLADLEYFALGERGDIYRGYLYPNDFDTHYEIDSTGSTEYNVISIEYFWQGGAENVQKSPRLLEIAAPATDSNDVITSLYNSVKALVDPE